MWRLLGSVMAVLACFSLSQESHPPNTADDRELVEPPLPLAVPLPPECLVVGTGARWYEQGRCSRRPCLSTACTDRGQCCFDLGQTSVVNLECGGWSTEASVIVNCRCQQCSQLQAKLQGKVVSSLGREPVILASITVGGEITAFTDHEGLFSFELPSGDHAATLLIQEPQHKATSRTVAIQPSHIMDLTLVVLEHIETVVPVPSLQRSFTAVLSTPACTEDHGLTVDVTFPAESFAPPDSELGSELGSGQLQHTLYHTGNLPDPTSAAFQRMLYTNYRGEEFALHSHAMGSLAVLSHTGQSLSLKPAATATFSMAIKFGVELQDYSVENLRLFVFCNSAWKDHSAVTVISVDHIPGELGSLVQLQASLTKLHTHWALAFPLRVSCYIKTRILSSSSSQQQDLVGASVLIEQNDDSLGRSSFSQVSAATVSGVGVCLPSVCRLGGIISVDKALAAQATPPSVSNGIVLGNKEQIIFYTTANSQLVVDGRTPYYRRLEACLKSFQKPTAFFQFTSPSPEPTMEPHLLPMPDQLPQQPETCFIKVAVYNSQAFSDVKVLSFSAEGKLLSLTTRVLSSSPCSSYPCLLPLRATCVPLPCSSTAHVSVQSRRESGAIDCRYWSSSPSLPPLTSHMTSFVLPPAVGQYSSPSPDLAELQCNSGSGQLPSSFIDPHHGSAVTFTCQE